jgi:hypothetical protein
MSVRTFSGVGVAQSSVFRVHLFLYL